MASSDTLVAAFFDFDGTLYAGHIWQELARHHWRAKQQRRWVGAYVARNMALWPLYRSGLWTQVHFYQAWGETMAWLLRGWSIDKARVLFEHLTEERIAPNLRASTLSLLAQHQNQGHLTVLVSGTFAPWLELVAHRLEVPHAIGTPLEVHDGRYTGRIIKPLCQGPGKPLRAKAYLDQKGLEVDWTRSFAYADSGTDVPLLSQVGQPVAVYPDEKLLAHARTKGWNVIGATEI